MSETEVACEPEKSALRLQLCTFHVVVKKSPKLVDLTHYFLSGETGEEEEGHLLGIDGERGHRRTRSPLRSGWAYSELEPNSGTLARLSSGSAVPP